MRIILSNVTENCKIVKYEWSNSKKIENLFTLKKVKFNPRYENAKWKGKSFDEKVEVEIVVCAPDPDVPCTSISLDGEPKDVLMLLEQIIPSKETYKKMNFKSPWGDNICFLKEKVQFS